MGVIIDDYLLKDILMWGGLKSVHSLVGCPSDNQATSNCVVYLNSVTIGYSLELSIKWKNIAYC